MKQKIVFVGITLLVIGILAIIFSLVKIPFQEQEPYDVHQSSNLINEHFNVPVGGESSRQVDLLSGDEINIDFAVYSHSDVNFYCRNRQGTYLSLTRVTSYNNTLKVPNNATYFFVWDNSYSTFKTKTVTTTISKVWTEIAYQDITTYHTIIPSAYTTITQYIGIGTVFVGIALIGSSIASNHSISSENTKDYEIKHFNFVNSLYRIFFRTTRFPKLIIHLIF